MHLFTALVTNHNYSRATADNSEAVPSTLRPPGFRGFDEWIEPGPRGEITTQHAMLSFENGAAHVLRKLTGSLTS